MVLLYGLAEGNSYQAQRFWIERLPDQRVPHPSTFVSMMQHLREKGIKSNRADAGRPRTNRILDAEVAILEDAEETLGISTRQLARQHQVSQLTAWRTLHEQGLHPYHVQKVQALLPRDPQIQIAYCQWLLQQIGNNERFLQTVLFTDESQFT